jgi:hypothetical protein
LIKKGEILMRNIMKFNKQILLFLFILNLAISSLLISSFVSAENNGVCLRRDYDNNGYPLYCEQIPVDECCYGLTGNELTYCKNQLYNNTMTSDEIRNYCLVDRGCCITDIGCKESELRKFCLRESGNVFVYDDNDCTSVYSENIENSPSKVCQEGCCVYKLGSRITDCDYGVKKLNCKSNLPRIVEFIPYSPYFGDTNCTDICNQQQIPVGNIAGHVFLSNGAEIITGDTYLKVAGRTSYVSLSGYGFTDIPVGNRSVTVYSPGYEPITKYAEVMNGVTVELNFTLKSATSTGTVHGYVLDSSQKPIKSAYVFYSNGGKYTDFNGYYRIKNVLEGEHRFTAFARGFIKVNKTILVSSGQETELDFNLIPSTGATTECGDGDVDSDLGEQCDLGDKNGIAGSGCTSDCQEEVCGTTTTSGTGRCVVFSYQCTTYRFYHNLDSSCGHGNPAIGLPQPQCCNGSITEIPDCINGAGGLTNKRIAETDTSGSGGTYCYCTSTINTHSDYWDTSPSSDESNLFCCNGYISTKACLGEDGFLTGHVYNADTKEQLNDVDITIRNNDGRVVATTITHRDITKTPENGTYNITIPPGRYTVTASLTGYQSNTSEVIITSYKTVTLNLAIKPKTANCITSFPAPILEVANIRGKPQFYLTWSHSCPDKYIDEFRLFRDGFPRGVFKPPKNDYLDVELEWDIEYTYILNVTSIYGITNTTSVTVNTGNKVCEDKTDDDYSFCINSSNENGPSFTKRAYCDEQNQIVVEEDCSNTFPNGLCRSPSLGVTECVRADDCEKLGIEPYPSSELPNVLGLYYINVYYEDSLSCTYNISSNTRRFCYYDYSDTTIDKCFNCESNGNCFDYKSESACLSDNCLYGKTRDIKCKWFSDYNYSDLGKGICYIENYKGTNFCNICDSTNPLFRNLHCSPEVCSKLGACFSNPSETSCQGCDERTTTKCEDYKDEFSCTGNQNFEIPGTCGSSTSFIYSNDACNRKRCRWDGGKCFKNANNDTIPDCSPSDASCQIDFSPPITTISSKPAVINSNGGMISFDIEDNALSYFCISNTNTCCPNKQIINKNITFTKNNLANLSNLDLSNVDDNYYIYFYSVDKYNNTELIKNDTLYFDTIPPRIAIYTPIMTYSTDNDTTMDVTIPLQFYDKARCSDALTGKENRQNITNKIINPGYINVTFTNLYDGNYNYEITCTDFHGNTAYNTTSFTVDRIKKILELKPNETVKGPVISLFIKTSDPYYCQYYNDTNWQPLLQDATEKTTTIFLNDGIYEWDVECCLDGFCYDSTGTRTSNTFIDGSNFYFAVDNTAPNVTLMYQQSTGSFLPVIPDMIITTDTLFKLECDDPSINGAATLNEFGCDYNSITYCISSSVCEPDIVFNPSTNSPQAFFKSKSAGKYNVCYIAKDKGGNPDVPDIRCIIINVDDGYSSLSITSPTDGYITDLSEIIVKGTWSDSSGLDYLVIEYFNSSGIIQTRETKITGKTRGEFTSLPLQLYYGINTIRARAKDNAEPRPYVTTSASINVYRDNIGPNISDIVILNNKTEEIQDKTNKFAEYKTNITFRANVDDPEWSNGVNLVEVRFNRRDGDTSTGCLTSGTIQLTQISSTEYLGVLNSAGSNCLEIGNYSAVFYAEDEFSNSAEKISYFIVDDSVKPFINITSPDDGYVTNTNTILITGTYIEPNLDFINITIRNSSGAITQEITATHDNGNFNTEITLSSGRNIITATAYDKSDNQKSSVINIYYDDVGPSITNIKIFNDYGGDIQDRANKFAEYKTNITFRANVDDPEWSNGVNLVEVRFNRRDGDTSTGCLTSGTIQLTQISSTEYLGVLNSAGSNCLEIGNYSAVFYAEDEFSNSAEKTSYFTVDDTRETEINITILKDSSEVTRLGYGNYDVSISSSIPLIDIKYLNYSFDSEQDSVKSITGTETKWRGILEIPKIKKYRNLDNAPATFLIRAININNKNVKSIKRGKSFIINTKGPKPPKIYDIPIYTNKQNVLITGFERNKKGNYGIIIERSDTGTLWDSWDESRTTSNQAPTLLESFNSNYDKIIGSYNPGSTYVIVEDIDNKFDDRDGTYIKFIGKERTNNFLYGPIVVRALGGDYKNISFSPGLEDAIDNNDKIEIYDSQVPEGWFSITINLNIGENYIRGKEIDELGNIGEPTPEDEYKFIIYDNIPPDIKALSPAPGSTTNDPRINISAKITDSLTKINKSSILFKLDTAREEIRLVPSGDYNYKLIFTNRLGIKYNTEVFAYDTNTDSIKLGKFSDSVMYDLVINETRQVAKNEFFVLSKNKYSHIMQFKNVRPGTSTSDNQGTLVVKDVGDGTLHEITYTNLEGTLNLDGNKFKIKLSSDNTSATINVDFNGDGTFSNTLWSPELYTKYGAKINLLTTDDSIIITTEKTEDNTQDTIKLGIIKNSEGKIDTDDNAIITGSNPTDSLEQNDNGGYKYSWVTGYGAYVEIDRKGQGSTQNDFKVIYPDNEVTDEFKVISCASPYLTCTKSSDEKGFNLIYTTPTELKIGSYSATISVSDIVGNLKSLDWGFVVDTKTPSAPTINVTNGYQGSWYVRSTPQILIEYKQESIVNITDIYLLKNSNPNQRIDVTYQRIANTNNLFRITGYSSELVDGEYELTIKDKKQYHDKTWSNEGVRKEIIIMDQHKPEIDVTIPEYTNNNKITVTINYNDAHIYYINITGDILPDSNSYKDESELKDRNSYTVNLELTKTSHNDVNTINFIAVDKARNKALKIKNVTIDKNVSGALSISSNTHPDQNKWYDDPDPEFELSAYDPNGIKGYSYLIDRNPDTNPDENEQNESEGYWTVDSVIKYSNLEHGTWYFHARGEDSIGNWGETEHYQVNIDLQGPQIKLKYPIDGMTSTKTPTINISTDEYANCDIEYRWREGINKEKFITSNHEEHYLTIPKEKALLIDDIIMINITCEDIFGHKNREVFKLVYDTTNPEITEFYIKAGILINKTSQEKTYIITDSSKAETRLRLDTNEETLCKYSTIYNDYTAMENSFGDEWKQNHISNLMSLTDGKTYNYNIACKDKAGLVSTVKTINIIVNFSAGIYIYDASPIAYTNERNPTISVKTRIDANCSINYLEPGGVLYRWWRDIWEALTGNPEMEKSNKGSYFLHSIKVARTNAGESLTENEIYEFEVKCRDPTDVFEETTIKLDFIPDYSIELNIIKPEEGYKTNNSELVIEGDTKEKYVSYEIYVNEKSQIKGKVDNDGMFVNTVYLDEGLNEIKVIVTDRAGNSKINSVNVEYINIGPSVKFILPDNGGPFNKIEKIIAELTDNGGGVNLNASSIILIRTNDSQKIGMSKEIDKENIRLIYKISEQLSTATYRAIAIPIDNLGNVGDKDIIEFIIDKKSPRITLTSPENLKTYTTKDIPISYSIDTFGQNLKKVYLIINDINSSSIHTNNSMPLDSKHHFIKKLEEGEYDLYIIAETTAGNKGLSPDIRFNVDVTGPRGDIDVE